MLYIDGLLRADENILQLMTSSVSCCPNKCLRKLSMEDIIYCEKSLKTEEQTNRRNLILDYLHKHSKPVTSGGIETKFFAGGKSVCKQAWLLAHDVKPDTFQWIYKEFRKGVVRIEHGNLGNKRPTKKTKDCIAWLDFFVNCVGHHQPDQPVIHLPSCFSVRAIYKQNGRRKQQFWL